MNIQTMMMCTLHGDHPFTDQLESHPPPKNFWVDMCFLGLDNIGYCTHMAAILAHAPWAMNRYRRAGPAAAEVAAMPTGLYVHLGLMPVGLYEVAGLLGAANHAKWP